MRPRFRYPRSVGQTTYSDVQIVARHQRLHRRTAERLTEHRRGSFLFDANVRPSLCFGLRLGGQVEFALGFVQFRCAASAGSTTIGAEQPLEAGHVSALGTQGRSGAGRVLARFFVEKIAVETIDDVQPRAVDHRQHISPGVGRHAGVVGRADLLRPEGLARLRVDGVNAARVGLHVKHAFVQDHAAEARPRIIEFDLRKPGTRQTVSGGRLFRNQISSASPQRRKGHNAAVNAAATRKCRRMFKRPFRGSQTHPPSYPRHRQKARENHRQGRGQMDFLGLALRDGGVYCRGLLRRCLLSPMAGHKGRKSATRESLPITKLLVSRPSDRELSTGTSRRKSFPGCVLRKSITSKQSWGTRIRTSLSGPELLDAADRLVRLVTLAPEHRDSGVKLHPTPGRSGKSWCRRRLRSEFPSAPAP